MEIRTRLPVPLLLIFLCVFWNSHPGLTEGDTYAHAEEAENTGKFAKEKIETLALIPFTSKTGIRESMPEEEITTNERFLTISLYDALLVETSGIKITPLKESEAEYMKTKSEKPLSYYRDLAVSAGKSLGVDAVMTGTISEYTERKGSELGVESPASVAFSVELLDTRDGRILWETYFSETQKPLFQNLFEINKFLKRGGKWISVDELAKEGARKAAEEFNRYLVEN